MSPGTDDICYSTDGVKIKTSWNSEIKSDLQ